MARLYLDNDVSLRLVPLLEEVSHTTTSAVSLGLATAGDEVQLLTAVQPGEILITYNRRDFMLLHRAWLLWPSSFGVGLPPHSGVLVLDQIAVRQQFDALYTLLSASTAENLSNQLLWWHTPARWRSLSGSGWRPI